MQRPLCNPGSFSTEHFPAGLIWFLIRTMLETDCKIPGSKFRVKQQLFSRELSLYIKKNLHVQLLKNVLALILHQVQKDCILICGLEDTTKQNCEG